MTDLAAVAEPGGHTAQRPTTALRCPDRARRRHRCAQTFPVPPNDPDSALADVIAHLTGDRHHLDIADAMRLLTTIEEIPIVTGFEQASTETLTVIAANLRRGLALVADRITAGTFHTVGPKGAAPPAQSGHLTLALLDGVLAELAARERTATPPPIEEGP